MNWRRIIWIIPLCLICVSAHAQCTLSSYLGFQIPIAGATTWANCVNGDLILIDSILGGTATLTPASTTPSVAGFTNWLTANTGAVTITNFTGGFVGQRINILCGASDTFTAISSDVTIAVVSPWSCSSAKTLTLVLVGIVWTETTRTASGSTFASPNITGTVTGGASYTAPTLTSPTTTGTDTGVETLTNKTLTSPVINSTPTGTGIATIVQVFGTNGGNYTRTTASFAVIDGTNLLITKTIPAGWKATVMFEADGNFATSCTFPTCSVALFDGASQLGPARNTVSPGTNTGFNIVYTLTGDGASHTFQPEFEGDGTRAVTIANVSGDYPTLTMIMQPSN